MASTVDRVLAVAAGELNKGGTTLSNGVHWIGSPTRSHYCSWFGVNDLWCAMFVAWVAHTAGAASAVPHSAATSEGREFFVRAGRWHGDTRGIRRGDVVYFKFGRGAGPTDHVGIVESVDAGGSVRTIEGNTSLTSRGSQRSSGCVARKTRRAGIVGYGRPLYSTADSAGGAPGSGSSGPVGAGRDGSHAAAELAVDGYWGGHTTRALQIRFGTPVDGAVSGQLAARRAANPGLTSGWEWREASRANGSPLIAAIQRWLAVAADGLAGPVTFGALQTRMRAGACDGFISAPSPAVAELQRRLNAGTL